MDDQRIVAVLREIEALTKMLRQSDVPVVQNYAITVMAETRGVLAQIPQLEAPERMTGFALPD